MRGLRITILFLALGMAFAVKGQLSEEMERAVGICKSISDAVYGSSTAPLKAANRGFKSANIIEFGFLRLEKGNSEMDIDGHLLFDEEFIDSLIVNRKVIAFSKKYNEKRRNRASAGKKGSIQLSTKALGAGQKAVWKTFNRDIAEYALVAEPNGLFTMTIRDDKGNVLYAETKDNKKGAPVRRARLELPSGKRTNLLIEVVNRGDRDASFALLGN